MNHDDSWWCQWFFFPILCAWIRVKWENAMVFSVNDFLTWYLIWIRALYFYPEVKEKRIISILDIYLWLLFILSRLPLLQIQVTASAQVLNKLQFIHVQTENETNKITTYLSGWLNFGSLNFQRFIFRLFLVRILYWLGLIIRIKCVN